MRCSVFGIQNRTARHHLWVGGSSRPPAALCIGLHDGKTQPRNGRPEVVLSAECWFQQRWWLRPQWGLLVVLPMICGHGTRGGGGYAKLEFLHFKFCTTILYAVCSVFLRICAGNNSKCPLFVMSIYWEPCMTCSLIFEKWHRFLSRKNV